MTTLARSRWRRRLHLSRERLPISWRHGPHEDGSTIVGLLLIFPFMLLATFGLFQFILYGLAVEEISTAAREAARRVALDGGTPADGAELANQLVDDSVVLDGQVNVTAERGPELTTVTVAGRCRWLLSDDLFGNTCDIERTAAVPTEGFVSGIVAS